jgi:hypothetical protein
MDATAMHTGRRSWLAWPVAAVSVLVIAWLFWPGFMSPDSASQWAQARGGRYTDVHPPILALIWSLTERIWSGPGLILLLHLSLLWTALAWIARECFVRPTGQVLLLLLVGLWPVVLGVSVHIWKDVPMAAFALLGVAALLTERRRPGWPWLALAVLLFAFACAYRHNALTLILPLLWYVTGRMPGLADRGWSLRGVATVLLAALIALLASLPSRHPAVTQRTVWPVTALWDIAAVSIARGEDRIPDSWKARDVTVDELAAVFAPWSNTSIFATGKLEISLYFDPSPQQMSDLRRAWLQLWWQTPGDMLAHRARLTAMLFGLQREGMPAGLTLAPGWHRLDVNPPLEVAPSPMRERVTAGLIALVPTPVFAAWPYLLVVVVLLVVTRRRPVSPLLHPVLWSAVFLCLPLPLLAPSAEFRYLYWLVLVAMLSPFLLRDGPHRAMAYDAVPDRSLRPRHLPR